ncbi:hypothetical protein PPERSA_02943 [Pseudocohnilembus persalinus]|uniref:Uncharacterized protein n=1 Tax=Pseudocohnilembus persalinus TaxID=266149 RepID=A0A0V0QAK9_PSEPJ|nr:hypothetical protein PPERSA_02943 [Pseudocohnilembus persalinus]|eukprot:KRW99111.1 hypothetical protein PPERSA_02943 [Pseudocohnilembus persalinus]
MTNQDKKQVEKKIKDKQQNLVDLNMVNSESFRIIFLPKQKPKINNNMNENIQDIEKICQFQDEDNDSSQSQFKEKYLDITQSYISLEQDEDCSYQQEQKQNNLKNKDQIVDVSKSQLLYSNQVLPQSIYQESQQNKSSYFSKQIFKGQNLQESNFLDKFVQKQREQNEIIQLKQDKIKKKQENIVKKINIQLELLELQAQQQKDKQLKNLQDILAKQRKEQLMQQKKLEKINQLVQQNMQNLEENDREQEMLDRNIVTHIQSQRKLKVGKFNYPKRQNNISPLQKLALLNQNDKVAGVYDGFLSDIQNLKAQKLAQKNIYQEKEIKKWEQERKLFQIKEEQNIKKQEEIQKLQKKQEQNNLLLEQIKNLELENSISNDHILDNQNMFYSQGKKVQNITQNYRQILGKDGDDILCERYNKIIKKCEIFNMQDQYNMSKNLFNFINDLKNG